MRIIFWTCLGLALAASACAPVPDSGNTVYLEAVTPTARAARNAELQASNEERGAVRTVSLEPIDPMRAEVSPSAGAEATVVPLDDPSAPSDVATSDDVAAPTEVATASETVTAPGTLTDDSTYQSGPVAATAAPAASSYEVVAPQPVPQRSSSGEPNVVAYALATSHPIGESRYARDYASDTRTQRACARYASPDQAQTAFLKAGGPEQDRQGLDPDGDGYACAWSPEPFRRAVDRS